MDVTMFSFYSRELLYKAVEKLGFVSVSASQLTQIPLSDTEP